MTELKRLALICVTTPFLVLGMVWQIVSGGFMAGRIMTTAWTAKLAKDVAARRTTSVSGQSPNKDLH